MYRELDAYHVVATSSGVWVRHEQSGEAWKLASAAAIDEHGDDRLADDYRTLYPQSDE